MTQAGVILGTAAYMSPEQARGKAVDKRADIWAFGVVLLEMLTGERVFKGDDVSETLASILKDAPALDALPAGTPPRLRRLLERCLDRDVKQRLRDIGEARVEIAKIQSGAPEPAIAVRSRVAAPIDRSGPRLEHCRHRGRCRRRASGCCDPHPRPRMRRASCGCRSCRQAM